MRNKSFCIFILTAILSMLFIIACEKDGVKDGVTISQIKEFISIGGDDGYIENLPTRVVHNYYVGPQGKSLNIGWNGNGFAMRGFISFDVSDMFPTANKELVIDEAVLSVYEANTNQLPLLYRNSLQNIICLYDCEAFFIWLFLLWLFTNKRFAL